MRWLRPLVAVLAGALVAVLLFPYSGVDTQPPECYSVFGYVVPCDGAFAVVSAVGAGALVAVGILLGSRGGTDH